MLLRIKGLIPSDKLISIRNILDSAEFIDGKLSAGKEAVRVKDNEELPQNHPDMAALNNIVMGHLVNHPIYKYGVLPHRIAAPFYSRYTSGKQYGMHVDDPVMGTGDSYRTDVSITVFLNEPDEYEGGELTICSQHGEVSNKFPAGDAILYPSGSLHQIQPITKGTRLVAVTWAQSMIRNTEQRELLYNLSQARDELMKSDPDSSATQKISTCYINLVRLWAEV